MATFRNRSGKWQARVQTKGHHCNMFYKQLKTRGRPPSGYAQLNLSDPEQLALAILKTLFKQ